MVFEMGNGFESQSECVMHILTNLLTLKWTYGHSGNNNRVAAISKSYLTHHEKFKIDRTILTCLN